MTFALVTFAAAEGPRVGVLTGDRVADAESVVAVLGGGRGMQALLDQWDGALPLCEELAAQAASGQVPAIALSEARLLAPLPRPVSLYCAFANYVDHMKEMGGTPADPNVEDPFLFLVPPTAVIGPEAPIVLPAGMTQVDWEGELAAVIGRAARDLSVDRALSCVAGYTIVHDVSARGGARRGAPPAVAGLDFIASKGRATFKPLGPAIVPAQFVSDPQALQLQTRVNGVLKQDSSTAQMIFSTAQMIAFVSHVTGVVPGDVFATGTPAGVGLPRREFLKPGDTVAITIERVGTLRNPVTSG